MRYGFVLDQTRCIGCHACTVACKSENEVPLGVFRTWVKYIETGAFPDAKRHFAVLRCNQCEDSPCTTICPTRALYRRPDGIVDFDSDACIGCKSCMQACPYDAIYIDPSEGTAAKCNYCAHRVDVGLAPACEIVCPTQAIISGDLDDPESPISKARARAPELQVRKPDQHTKPNVFYIGANEVALDPRLDRDISPMYTDPGPLKTESADIGLTREVYDVVHDAPWGWKVWLYLWTKSVAAGVLMVASFLALSYGRDPGILPPAVALVFITITTALLVFDLKRPERFWYLMVRPNFSSWLVWGGYILGAFTLLSAGWLAAAWMKWPIPDWVHWLTIPLGAATAGYSAFLFNQAEGRDFWQSKLLLPHLLAEALLCGAATLLLIRAEPLRTLDVLLAVGIVLHLAFILVDLFKRHDSLDARRASREITHGMFAGSFWWNVVALDSVLPLAILAQRYVVAGWATYSWAAAIFALAGALKYGRLWIKAGQAPRLS